MAPELICSNEQTAYDQKVDIWSIGCIIYYILSGGRHAFCLKDDDYSDEAQLAQSICHDEPNFIGL